jgi:hypothetical protein
LRRLALLLLTIHLLLPAALHAQALPPAPGGQLSPLEPPTLVVTPTASPTVTPTPLPTPTPEPTATATPTLAPYQVSPLVAQENGSLPDDGASLWIGGAALLVLAGSAVLVLAERRGRG